MHVAVVEMPGVVVERLRDAVTQGVRGGGFQAGGAPGGSEGDGIVAASVITVNIEDFDRIVEFVVVAGGMMPELSLLEPERVSLFGVGHARGDGASDDFLHGAKVASIGEPGIDDLGIADVFQAHGPVRFPGLHEGALAIDTTTHGRPAITPIHRAALHDGVFMLGRR